LTSCGGASGGNADEGEHEDERQGEQDADPVEHRATPPPLLGPALLASHAAPRLPYRCSPSRPLSSRSAIAFLCFSRSARSISRRISSSLTACPLLIWNTTLRRTEKRQQFGEDDLLGRLRAVASGELEDGAPAPLAQADASFERCAASTRAYSTSVNLVPSERGRSGFTGFSVSTAVPSREPMSGNFLSEWRFAAANRVRRQQPCKG
jgi:hypothetical protein